MKSNIKLIRVLGAAISLVALFVLTGWVFDIARLISITPNMTAMNPTTGVTFLFLSIWIQLRCAKKERKSWNLIEVAIATFALSIGALKIMEYTGILPDVHVDRILFHTKLSMRMRYNEIAPTTALIFFFISVILLNSYKTGRLRNIVNDTLFFITFLVAYLGIIGYIYSLEPFYRIGPFVPMALHTACCFMILIIAAFLLIPQGNLSRILFSRHVGGTMVRRVMPVILLIPPAFGYSRLLLHRAAFYNIEYGVALDTAFLVLIVLLLVFYYANVLNRKDYERKITEKVLAQSEEKFRSLVYSLKEGILYYNKECQIIFCNPSFASMMGYTQQELIGQNVIDVMTPEELRPKARLRMADRLSGIPEDYEGKLLHKDGSSITVHITARPIKEKETTTFLSTVIDITERKQKEEDIEAFSASAAHDLNAPLARIESLSSYLLEFSNDHLNEEDTEFLGMIAKTAVDMRALLKDLLLFSKSGVEKIVKVHVDMDNMVRSILKAYPHPEASVIFDNELPAANGDPAALRQVWTNLVLNAIKYSSKKGNPEVHIGTTLQHDKTVYYVKDNGAGFDMDEAWKLFAPFKRLHADFEGNGLGLPIVKRIVEKHGGKIWAEGQKEAGATFYFTL